MFISVVSALKKIVKLHIDRLQSNCFTPLLPCVCMDLLLYSRRHVSVFPSLSGSSPLRQRSVEEHLLQRSRFLPNGPDLSASKSNAALPLLLAEADGASY